MSWVRLVMYWFIRDNCIIAVVLQETKLSRQDLSADVIMADGYEAFVSCNRSSKGRGAYSGMFLWRQNR